MVFGDVRETEILEARQDRGRDRAVERAQAVVAREDPVAGGDGAPCERRQRRCDARGEQLAADAADGVGAGSFMGFVGSLFVDEVAHASGH